MWVPAQPCCSPLQGSTIPKPRFLKKTIQELCVGTFRDVAVVPESAPIYTALEIFVDRRVSALPVVNDAGTWRVKQSHHLPLPVALAPSPPKNPLLALGLHLGVWGSTVGCPQGPLPSPCTVSPCRESGWPLLPV